MNFNCDSHLLYAPATGFTCCMPLWCPRWTRDYCFLQPFPVIPLNATQRAWEAAPRSYSRSTTNLPLGQLDVALQALLAWQNTRCFMSCLWPLSIPIAMPMTCRCHSKFPHTVLYRLHPSWPWPTSYSSCRLPNQGPLILAWLLSPSLIISCCLALVYPSGHRPSPSSAWRNLYPLPGSGLRPPFSFCWSRSP